MSRTDVESYLIVCPAAPQTFRHRHLHLSDPRYGALKSYGRPRGSSYLASASYRVGETT
jgi:hypothetical protein